MPGTLRGNLQTLAPADAEIMAISGKATLQL
jgi:hypothetical protein